MPITVINDAGTVLLDDTYQNLALVYHTAVSTQALGAAHESDYYSANMNSGAGFVLTVADSQVGNPLVAVRCTSQVVAVAESYRTGAATTFLIKSRDPVWFDLYVFGLPQVIGGNGDMKLFNASGVKTFDSSLKYCRVVDFVQVYPSSPSILPPPALGNTGWAMPWAVSRGYDGSRIYAAAQVSSERFWDEDGRGSQDMYITERTIGSQFSGGSVRFDYAFTRQGIGGGDGGYDAHGALEASFLVLDVTGY
ncbi:hypothetical protein [Burkholderia sp. 22PA0106]|uniref:hypothetical protein n=1 Tax=Burkholderia sp. 22PA0106 TaxID=3237371 RepID=UPI0039C12CBD